MNTLPSALIAGEAYSGSGPDCTVINPATEETLATFKDAGADLVDKAAKAALACFDSGAWSKASVDQRQATLREIASTLEANNDAIADIEVSNTGLLLSQVQGMHVKRAAYNFRFFADFIGQVEDAYYDQAEDFQTTVRRFPVGVAGLIAPWNAPLALGSMKIAASIAFGNSCVIKPSEIAPLSLVRLVELIGETSLPKGVVNLVNGLGTSTGGPLVDHPDTSIISFTGGTATGRAIMSAAGKLLKPTTMELGGKSANIIFADADLDQAVDGALLAIYSANGQQCLAGSRILVQQPIAEAFMEKFVSRAKNMHVGDPRALQTELGPLISAAHRDRVLSYVKKAEEDGDTLLAGGKAVDGPGYYIEPTVVHARSNHSRVCAEEIFGPFASILTFETAEDAFAIANASPYGLVSYVWSQDIYTINAAQDAINAGVVWVNTTMMRELRAPFGGINASGVGAEGGRACQALYTREKTVTIPRQKLDLPKLGMG